MFTVLFNSMVRNMPSLLLCPCLFAPHSFYLDRNLPQFKLLSSFLCSVKVSKHQQEKNRMKKRMDLHVPRAEWTVFIVFAKRWSEKMGVKRPFQCNNISAIPFNFLSSSGFFLFYFLFLSFGVLFMSPKFALFLCFIFLLQHC